MVNVDGEVVSVLDRFLRGSPLEQVGNEGSAEQELASERCSDARALALTGAVTWGDGQVGGAVNRAEVAQ